MRKLLKATSTSFFALALAFGTLASVGASLQAAPAVAACPWAIDIFGNPVCPANPCGFLGLKTYTRIIWLDPVTGLPTGQQTCECRW